MQEQLQWASVAVWRRMFPIYLSTCYPTFHLRTCSRVFSNTADTCSLPGGDSLRSGKWEPSTVGSFPPHSTVSSWSRGGRTTKPLANQEPSTHILVVLLRLCLAIGGIMPSSGRLLCWRMKGYEVLIGGTGTGLSVPPHTSVMQPWASRFNSLSLSFLTWKMKQESLWFPDIFRSTEPFFY